MEGVVSKTIDQKESVDRSEFRELISECVGKYNPNIDIKEYLLSILQKYNVCADDYERNRTIREIHLVIDGIATEYQKLLTFKNKGNSRIDWLINKADELSNIPEEKKLALLIDICIPSYKRAFEEMRKNSKELRKKTLEKS